MAQGVANPQNATNNFSLALAGAVSVLNDESVVQTEIKNSTLRTGDELNVSSSRDNFLLNLTGGGARAGNFGGGAAVNVYADKGAAKSIIEGSIIEFWSDAGSNEMKFNVSATSEHRIIEAAVGSTRILLKILRKRKLSQRQFPRRMNRQKTLTLM